MAAASEKLVMGAALNDFAVLENQNLMRVADRGKPMGDDEAGPPLKQLLQRALDDDLGVRVNAIQPGLIRSAMTEAMPQRIWDSKVAEVPMGRAGELVYYEQHQLSLRKLASIRAPVSAERSG